MKGYKVLNSDWTCRGFKYEVGKIYKHEGDISLCNKGFHFCRKIADCFSYYDFDPKNKVAEIEAIGLVESDETKSVTNEIKILREISWEEMLKLANEGHNNDACRLMWDKLDDDEKQAVKEIPYFDAEVFKEITGIDVNEGGE